MYSCGRATSSMTCTEGQQCNFPYLELTLGRRTKPEPGSTKERHVCKLLKPSSNSSRATMFNAK
eukprot:1588-Heterococcus_DN1.PRE.3